jgi:hypothetical protein
VTADWMLTPRLNNALLTSSLRTSGKKNVCQHLSLKARFMDAMLLSPQYDRFYVSPVLYKCTASNAQVEQSTTPVFIKLRGRCRSICYKINGLLTFLGRRKGGYHHLAVRLAGLCTLYLSSALSYQSHNIIFSRTSTSNIRTFDTDAVDPLLVWVSSHSFSGKKADVWN